MKSVNLKFYVILFNLIAVLNLSAPSISHAAGGSPLFRSSSWSSTSMQSNCYNMPPQCGGGGGGCVAINNGSGSGGGLGGIFGGLGSAVGGIFNGIGGLVRGAVNTVGGLLGGIGNGIASIFGGGNRLGTNGGVSGSCVAANFNCVANYPRGTVRDVGVVAVNNPTAATVGTGTVGSCPTGCVPAATSITSPQVSGTNTTAIVPGGGAAAI